MGFSLPLELRGQRGQTYIFVIYSHYVNILASSWWFFYSALYHDLVVIEMGVFFLKYLILDHHNKGFKLQAEMHLNGVMPIGL